MDVTKFWSPSDGQHRSCLSLVQPTTTSMWCPTQHPSHDSVWPRPSRLWCSNLHDKSSPVTSPCAKSSVRRSCSGSRLHCSSTDIDGRIVRSQSLFCRSPNSQRIIADVEGGACSREFVENNRENDCVSLERWRNAGLALHRMLTKKSPCKQSRPNHSRRRSKLRTEHSNGDNVCDRMCSSESSGIGNLSSVNPGNSSRCSKHPKTQSLYDICSLEKNDKEHIDSFVKMSFRQRLLSSSPEFEKMFPIMFESLTNEKSDVLDGIIGQSPKGVFFMPGYNTQSQIEANSSVEEKSVNLPSEISDFKLIPRPTSLFIVNTNAACSNSVENQESSVSNKRNSAYDNSLEHYESENGCSASNVHCSDKFASSCKETELEDLFISDEDIFGVDCKEREWPNVISGHRAKKIDSQDLIGSRHRTSSKYKHNVCSGSGKMRAEKVFVPNSYVNVSKSSTQTDSDFSSLVTPPTSAELHSRLSPIQNITCSESNRVFTQPESNCSPLYKYTTCTESNNLSTQAELNNPSLYNYTTGTGSTSSPLYKYSICTESNRPSTQAELNNSSFYKNTTCTGSTSSPLYKNSICTDSNKTSTQAESNNSYLYKYNPCTKFNSAATNVTDKNYDSVKVKQCSVFPQSVSHGKSSTVRELNCKSNVCNRSSALNSSCICVPHSNVSQNENAVFSKHGTIRSLSPSGAHATNRTTCKMKDASRILSDEDQRELITPTCKVKENCKMEPNKERSKMNRSTCTCKLTEDCGSSNEEKGEIISVCKLKENSRTTRNQGQREKHKTICACKLKNGSSSDKVVRRPKLKDICGTPDEEWTDTVDTCNINTKNLVQNIYDHPFLRSADRETCNRYTLVNKSNQFDSECNISPSVCSEEPTLNSSFKNTFKCQNCWCADRPADSKCLCLNGEDYFQDLDSSENNSLAKSDNSLKGGTIFPQFSYSQEEPQVSMRKKNSVSNGLFPNNINDNNCEHNLDTFKNSVISDSVERRVPDSTDNLLQVRPGICEESLELYLSRFSDVEEDNDTRYFKPVSTCTCSRCQRRFGSERDWEGHQSGIFSTETAERNGLQTTDTCKRNEGNLFGECGWENRTSSGISNMESGEGNRLQTTQDHTNDGTCHRCEESLFGRCGWENGTSSGISNMEPGEGDRLQTTQDHINDDTCHRCEGSLFGEHGWENRTSAGISNMEQSEGSRLWLSRDDTNIKCQRCESVFEGRSVDEQSDILNRKMVDKSCSLQLTCKDYTDKCQRCQQSRLGLEVQQRVVSDTTEMFPNNRLHSNPHDYIECTRADERGSSSDMQQVCKIGTQPGKEIEGNPTSDDHPHYPVYCCRVTESDDADCDSAFSEDSYHGNHCCDCTSSGDCCDGCSFDLVRDGDGVRCKSEGKRLRRKRRKRLVHARKTYERKGRSSSSSCDMEQTVLSDDNDAGACLSEANALEPLSNTMLQRYFLRGQYADHTDEPEMKDSQASTELDESFSTQDRSPTKPHNNSFDLQISPLKEIFSSPTQSNFTFVSSCDAELTVQQGVDNSGGVDVERSESAGSWGRMIDEIFLPFEVMITEHGSEVSEVSEESNKVADFFRAPESDYPSSDSGDADDEFECDCEHCQLLRGSTHPDHVSASIAAGMLSSAALDSLITDGSQISNPWETDWAASGDNDFDVSLDDFRPLEPFLLGLQQLPQDPIELMYQNVIMQMLTVHPELLGELAPPPVSLTVIDSLDIVIASKENTDTDLKCPICLCRFEEGEELTQLPCQHLYHPLCIQAWLVKSGTCPVCRHILQSEW